MDELQLIRQFRADLPVVPSARERAHGALRARITGRRRRRKLVLAVAFAVTALLVTGVALGLADDVIDLVRGKDAPKDVKTLSFRPMDKLPPGARWAWPQGDASRARGVSAVRVEGGLFGLWEAPVEGGGWCFATWVVDDEVSGLLAPEGTGACDFKPLPRGRMLAFTGHGLTTFFPKGPRGRHWVGSVFGVTPTEVTTVRVRFPSGRKIETRTLPSFYSKVRYFLVAVPRGSRDLDAEGLDARGRIVAKTPEGTYLSFQF